MDEIKITLTVNEANLVLTALGQMPYAQVFQVINKIQQQAQGQLNNQSPSFPNSNNDPA